MRLTSRDQLRLLLNTLLRTNGTYERYPIGVLKNALRGHFEVEVDVDQLPDVTSFVLQIKQDQDVPLIMKRKLDVYTVRPSQLEMLVRQPDVLDWTRPWECVAWSEIASQVMEKVAKEKGETCGIGTQGTYTYDFNPDQVLISDFNPMSIHAGMLADGYTYKSLTADQAKLVNDHWKFSEGDLTEKYIEYCIRMFPSTCIYNPQGAPVAWNLTWHCMAVGMAHVVPSERGKHLVAYIGKLTALKIKQLGDSVYGFIDEFNETSLRSIGRGGSRRLGGKGFWGFYEPPQSLSGSKL